MVEDSPSQPSKTVIAFKNIPYELAETSNKERPSPPKVPKYDFCAARKRLDKSNAYPSNTLCESISHMLNMFFGGGIFAMHVAFYSIGLTSAVIGLVILSIMVGISMCSLIKSAHKMYGRIQVAQLSYPDLAETVILLSPWHSIRKLSRFVRYFVEFILILYLFGSCIVYQILMAQNMKHLVEGTDAEDHGSKNVLKIYIMVLMVPCLVLVMVRNLKYLTPFTVVINLQVSMAALVTIFYGLRGQIKMDLIPSVKSTAGLFKFIGMSLFCLQGISISLPIENNMNKPKNFCSVVLGSLSYATSMMMVIGIFGYWGFGDKGVAPITIHFPWTHFPIMTKVFLSITSCIIYAEIFYFGFDIQWYYLKKLHPMYKWWYWERIYRAINVVIISTIACGIPNACHFMGFLGCFCVSLLSFIFPAFIKLMMDWERSDKRLCQWSIIWFIIMSTFGLSFMFIGSFYNLSYFF